MNRSQMEISGLVFIFRHGALLHLFLAAVVLFI